MSGGVEESQTNIERMGIPVRTAIVITSTLVFFGFGAIQWQIKNHADLPLHDGALAKEQVVRELDRVVTEVHDLKSEVKELTKAVAKLQAAYEYQYGPRITH